MLDVGHVWGIRGNVDEFWWGELYAGDRMMGI